MSSKIMKNPYTFQAKPYRSSMPDVIPPERRGDNGREFLRQPHATTDIQLHYFPAPYAPQFMLTLSWWSETILLISCDFYPYDLKLFSLQLRQKHVNIQISPQFVSSDPFVGPFNVKSIPKYIETVINVPRFADDIRKSNFWTKIAELWFEFLQMYTLQMTKAHCPNQGWPSLIRYICIICPQWDIGFVISQPVFSKRVQIKRPRSVSITIVYLDHHCHCRTTLEHNGGWANHFRNQCKAVLWHFIYVTFSRRVDYMCWIVLIWNQSLQNKYAKPGPCRMSLSLPCGMIASL